MVFSSVIFLFLFLPAVLLGYFLLPRAVKNLWLLAASLLFYAWGETFFVLLMLASVSMNYLFGLLIDALRDHPARKPVLVVSVAANLAFIGWYKYGNFLVDNLNGLTALAGLPAIDISPIHLPIGISFFTFQAMSYVIDVYRREAEVQRNPINIALYIALFPQLIAGPIVRYQDVARQLMSRSVDSDRFSYGVRRFTVGLAKKVILANTFAAPADAIFALQGQDLTTGTAWLGAICYTFQIYFDFSGYSDMAIGLGHMFGFHFLENFNFPYISQSIREFWRRWHLSLSTWFRDYLYIPLGGNRISSGRTHFNLVTVFFLCGLWHGASWTFVVWGLYHGLFLVLERTRFGRVLDRAWRPIRHAYTLLVVVVGWVFFRAETFSSAWSMLRAMAGFPEGDAYAQHAAIYLDSLLWTVLAAGVLGSMPILGRIALFKRETPASELVFGAGQLVGCAILLILCAALLSAGTHNPFIYFRF